MSETVKNAFLNMYLLFSIKFKKKKKKKKKMHLPIEVCRYVFTYLTLNDLIEISCLCKDFHHLFADSRLYVKKLNQWKRISKDRSWLFCHFQQLCENFSHSFFSKLVACVPIYNLIAARKIIHNRLYFLLLPFLVWNHLFHCCRSQYESIMCMF